VRNGTGEPVEPPDANHVESPPMGSFRLEICRVIPVRDSIVNELPIFDPGDAALTG